MSGQPAKPPVLIESSNPIPCGYAPRAILVSRDKRRLFVGCKDGSVTVIELGQAKDRGVWSIPAKHSPKAIGALCEPSAGRLLVGRSDGSIDLLILKTQTWRKHWEAPSKEPQDAIRLIDALPPQNASEGARILFSRRYSGTSVRPLKKVAAPSFLRPRDGSADERRLNGIRLVVRGKDNLLLATSRGEVWTWDGGGDHGVKRLVSLWSTNERPGLVNDFSVMTGAGGRSAILLATDLGVYWVDPEGDTFERLSLPGLGPICMAISYTRFGGQGFLWASDTRGESHIFWHAPESGQPAPRFLPSGVVTAGSQVLLVTSWEGGHSFFFAQVRRNDQAVITRCAIDGTNAKVIGAGEGFSNRDDYRLLRGGSVEELRELLKTARGGEQGAADWPGRAVLADFLELLAGEDEGLGLLKEFLGDPSAAVAASIVKTGGEDAGAAIDLWTHTFLGIVNRLPGNREALYLGILRWLGDLEQKCQKPGIEAIVQRNMRFVRKWGLYGEANSLRSNLVKPIRILKRQVDSQDIENPAPAVEALDLLTFESLLFYRGINLLHENASGFQRGRTAWSASQLKTDQGHHWVAISWSLGGIEVFGLDQVNGDFSFHLQFALRPRADVDLGQEAYDAVAGEAEIRRSPEHGQDRRHLYSRAVHLGRIGTGKSARYYLLAAPVRSIRADIGESIHLYELSLGKNNRLTPRFRGSQPLPKDESVYRFLEVQPGMIVAGLRGSGGVSALAQVSVERVKGKLSFHIHPVTQLPSSPDPKQPPGAGPAWRPQAYNRVWSLAPLERGDESSAPLEFAAGCEGGEIWRVGLSGDGRLECKSERPAAQISSAVRTLAFLELPAESRADGKTAAAPSSGRKAVRIIAGGSDGSVVAWQELPEKPSVMVTLWATLEWGGEITAIHPIRYQSGEEEQDRLILVISRSGRCILLDDRSDFEAPSGEKDRDRPQRTRVPGGRRGRLRLPGSEVESTATNLASFLLKDPLPGKELIWDEQTGRYAVMLSASESGRCRLYSLHFPRVIGNRKQKYKEILDQWWALVKRKKQGSPYENLRLADAAYQAIRLPPLVLVRWFLDPAWEGEPPFKSTDRWVMPRYLRPLIDLRAAWDAAETDEDSPRAASKALETLLRNARRLDDLDLFQEICAVSLKRANFELIGAAKRDGDGRRTCDLVLSVFRTIESLLERWIGVAGRSESRARITVAKNMIDGDTFWHVLQRAAHEGKEGPFREVLAKRIQAARQLVGKHDSLVSLETLRAINMSMSRLCKRFVEARGEDQENWAPAGEQPNEQEAYWPVFEPYFEALTYAAARVFRSPLELTDPLAHEYSRTFALTVCACPSAAIRIANRLTETKLISEPRAEQDDLATRIKRQFDLLASLGIQVPRYAQVLFSAEVQPDANRFDHPLKQAIEELNLGEPDADVSPPVSELEKTIGRENAEDVYCLWRVYSTVRWLGGLAAGLASDAGALDLSEETVSARRDWLMQKDPLMKRLYSHSRDCLNDMLQGLERCVPSQGGERTTDIRPEIVLHSAEIETWAKERLSDLEDRYRETLSIFEPQYSIFKNVLSRLQRVAHEFPQSASVQKSIALAILGHHLLEELDEQVFELEEIAQNLDPLMVWEFRDRNRTLTDTKPEAGATVAWRFAHYLLQRAYRAESIPKNLRALFGVLEASQEAQKEKSMLLGKHLLASFADRSHMPWDCGELVHSAEGLSPREFQCLHLVLSELDQNDRKYSGSAAGSSQRPRIRQEGDRPLKLTTTFWFKYDKGKIERLEMAKAKGLQGPLPPYVQRDMPSSGAGLYLANLAAAVVGWELRIEEVKGKKPWSYCIFSLKRRPEV